MKYQYIADISKALQKVYLRDRGKAYITGGYVPDEMVADIAVDVDAVARMLVQYEWDFRSDNSDRSAAGAKMPPELEQLEMKLDTCRKICSTVVTKQTDDAERAAWLKRESVFVWWIHMLVDYYPDARTTVLEREVYKKWKGPSERKTSTPTMADKAGRPLSNLSDYLIGVDVDSFKTELSPMVRGKKATELGMIIRREVQSGRLSDKKGFITAFLREFGLDSHNNINGVCKYFKRRQNAS